jgi:hypothetical protein
MSGRVLTCVYCGQEYPQDTPTHGHQILTDHIKICKKHPLREAEAEIAKLKKQIAKLRRTEQLTAEGLREACGDDIWGECPQYPVEEWHQSVQEDATRNGYWEWAVHKLITKVEDDCPNWTTADAYRWAASEEPSET